MVNLIIGQNAIGKTEYLRNKVTSISENTDAITNIIDRKLVIDSLQQVIKHYPDGINNRTLQWVLTADTSYLYTEDEALKHLDKVAKLYQENMPYEGETLDCFGEQIELTKVCWRKKRNNK